MAESELDTDLEPGGSSSFMSTDDGGSDQVMPTPASTESARNVPSPVASLLSRLRSPPLSELARQRKIRKNPPPKGQRRGKGTVADDPKNVSPIDRVRAYPNEPFTVSNKKLFCSACREELATKKSVIDLHLKSVKHDKGKQRLSSNAQKEEDIIQALETFDREHHPEGERLPISVRLYRIKVVRTMLRAGVPLSKVDQFRDLLEEHAFALTSATNLRQLLPFIHHEEVSRLKNEIANRPLSIIFDGTTHVSEAMVIVLRFITDSWEIKQCVCRLMLLAKSMTGEELARQLITALSTELGVPSNLLVASMRDRASVNDIAMKTVSVVYSKVIDIGCFSHTIDHVGERMKTPVLDAFSKGWIGLFSRSPKSRLAWRTLTGKSPHSYSPTRWWSRFEVLHELHDSFGDVLRFLEGDNMPAATSNALLLILHEPSQLRKLKMELAITIDAMEPFVKTTYILEGDGPLALVAYERLMALFQVITTEHYPNATALAKSISNGDCAREQQLLAYAKVCVVPAFTYFKSKFENDLKPTLLAFKAARFFSPPKINEIKPTAADIDSLRAIPYLNSNLMMDGLKAELPLYLAAAEDVSPQADPVQWWKSHKADLPKWAEACGIVLLMQPSSAAAERVFSILSNSFSDRQESSLEDYIELSVMLHYNHRS